MGLDIVAYQVVDFTKLDIKVGSEEFEEGDYVDLYRNPDFPAQPEWIESGVYRFSGKPFHFRAGPYSSYNEWRNHLSMFAFNVPASEIWIDSERYIAKPFYELINFSDCEGFFGPNVCKKLATDFMENAEAYLNELRLMRDQFTADYYRLKFMNFKQAFETAAHSGVVMFS